MTLTVKGDTVERNISETKTFSRSEAEHELAKAKAELPRWERQATNAAEGKADCQARIDEWQAAVDALPPLPEEPPEVRPETPPPTP